MSVRAKFKVTNIKDYDDTCKTISLEAVCAYDENGVRSDENESWSKWTPSGQININITNPDAFNQFEEGVSYYVDFTKA